jgi:heterodisulfide reductase subunit A
VVNALLCKGCGSCAATCFSGAIDVSGFSNRQIIREFEELLVR